MQGMPLEGYQPLPPNPLEDNYRREVENQSDAESAIAPPLDNLEDTLVTVENPTTPVSVTPLEPLLVRLDSLGNVIDEEVPRLPERIFTETYMGSTEPIFGDEYRTPVHPSTTVETNPHLLVLYGGLHRDAISMNISNLFDNPFIPMTLLVKQDHSVKP
jgi:hypothetical protein